MRIHHGAPDSGPLLIEPNTRYCRTADIRRPIWAVGSMRGPIIPLASSASLSNTRLRYIGLNILGPVCLRVSLAFNFNLAVVMTQMLWLLLTALGLAKISRARARRTPCTAQGYPENGSLAP